MVRPRSTELGKETHLLWSSVMSSAKEQRTRHSTWLGRQSYPLILLDTHTQPRGLAVQAKNMQYVF